MLSCRLVELKSPDEWIMLFTTFDATPPIIGWYGDGIYGINADERSMVWRLGRQKNLRWSLCANMAKVEISRGSKISHFFRNTIHEIRGKSMTRPGVVQS